MVYFVLLLIEIFILFLLSKSVSKNLSGFLSINMLSIIFLPGVIIHELSHYFIAAIMFVPVGSMEFIPQKDGDSVKLGSVEIGKADPLRRSIIGFAPVFVGLMIILGIVYLFSSNLLFFQSKNFYIFLAMILVLIYLLFAISNTMFSSRADMKGTAEVLIVILIFLVLAYVAGFRPQLSYLNRIFTKELIGAIQKSTAFLLVPIVLDLIIVGITRVIVNSRNQSF